MESKSGRLFAVTVSVLSLVLALHSPASAEDVDSANEYFLATPDSPATPHIELAQEETQALAEALRLPESEAVAFIAGQNEFGMVVAQLEDRFKSSFFSSGWEAGDGYRAWVSFVGQPPAEASKLIKSLPFTIQVRVDGPATEVELQSLVERVSAVLTGEGVQEAELNYDAHTGDVSAVYAPVVGLGESALQERIATLRASSPVSITLQRSADVGNALQSVIGGLWMSFAGKPNDCTTGFTVYKSGSPGVLAAGHCDNTGISIAGSSGTVYMGTEHVGSQGDFQWMATTDSIQNKVKTHAYGTTKAITAVSSASVGSSVCVFGAASAVMSCATVTDTNDCSTIQGVTTCQLVTTNAAITIGGDSGAPWSVGPAAYGIHRGICGGKSCYSKVQNAVTTLGVTIKLI